MLSGKAGKQLCLLEEGKKRKWMLKTCSLSRIKNPRANAVTFGDLPKKTCTLSRLQNLGKTIPIWQINDLNRNQDDVLIPLNNTKMME